MAPTVGIVGVESAVDRPLLEMMARGLETETPVRAAVQEPIRLSPDGLDRRGGQIRAGALLQQMARRPRRTDMVLLVLSEDLYAPGMNFVFGEADASTGVAIISLRRLSPRFYGLAEDRSKLESRALKEAVHEVGHLLGLRHCANPRCVMRFSNSLPETDRKGRSFCARCQELAERAAAARRPRFVG